MCSPRPQYSSVTKDNVQIVQWWKVFGLSSPYTSWRWTKTNHTSIPSLKITWVGWRNRQHRLSVHCMRVELGNQRASVVYQQLVLGRQTKSSWLWEPLSHRLTAQRWTQHSINRNLSCTASGMGDLEKKIGGILIPSWFGVGLLYPYTLAVVERVKWKFYLITFLFSIKCSHTHKIHTLWIWGGSFSSNF